MIYLLDSNIISYLVQENKVVGEHLNQLDTADRVIICTIVRGEILYGVQRMSAGKRKDEITEKLSKILTGFRCEPLPEGVADRYAVLKRSRQLMGLSIDDNDLWIGATALLLGAVLVTHDDDFRKINDLNVEDWTK
jgi:predicted nucleic acid-binding protein